jgi:hypothetical protein
MASIGYRECTLVGAKSCRIEHATATMRTTTVTVAVVVPQGHPLLNATLETPQK